MTHERYEQDVGAYLLGALPEPERDAFERHLEDCERCRDEVAELRVVADALPHAVEPVAPPPGLKAALMEIVEREAAAAEAPARRPARRPRFFALPRLRPATVAFAGAALLAIGVAAGYGLGAGSGQDTRTLTAAIDAKRLPATAAGTVTIPGDGGQAVLRVRGMPDVPAGSTYQVWLSRDGKVTSASLFTVGRDGSGAAAVPESVEGADAVMVTREAAGGAPAPTEPPVLTVRL